MQSIWKMRMDRFSEKSRDQQQPFSFSAYRNLFRNSDITADTSEQRSEEEQVTL